MGSEMSHFLVKNIIIHWKINSPWERNPVYISFLPLFKAKIVLNCWETLCWLRGKQSPGLMLCSISVTDCGDVRSCNIQSSQMILAKDYGDQESPWEGPLVLVVTDQWWCFGAIKLLDSCDFEGELMQSWSAVDAENALLGPKATRSVSPSSWMVWKLQSSMWEELHKCFVKHFFAHWFMQNHTVSSHSHH